MSNRTERDSLGEVQVPAEAYYGANTQRAIDNFRISGLALPGPLIIALARIKRQAARVNLALGRLPKAEAEAIDTAATEIIDGRHADQFPVDVFQTGSGTSTNMDLNEVIAGRANELLTGRRGGKEPVHPNDHVNRGQSTNDVFPTAIHLAAMIELRDQLAPALAALQKSLEAKADEFAAVVKTGRTHLQDALPVTLGREFGGYARQVELGRRRLEAVQPGLAELPLGGTAVGTGAGAPPEFAPRVIAALAAETGLPLVEAVDHFEANSARDAAVMAGGALKTVAVSLAKIAGDLRWLASGPRFGLGEITLPALQPGSSIMPGKVNPVVCEVVVQVAAQVIGLDAALTLGGLGGRFELNTMMPLIAHNLLTSISWLAAAARLLDERCVRGIQVGPALADSGIERNLMLATFLVPAIGYDRAAEVAREAARSGRTIAQAAVDLGLLDADQVRDLLDRARPK
jgi:fumarate hydratase class II